MTGDTFTAVTLNAAGGDSSSPTPAQLEPLLRRALNAGVTVLLLQELFNRDVVTMLRHLGLRLHFTAPELAVAWVPDTWTGITRESPRLSPTPFRRGATGKEVHSDGAAAILCDNAGRSLDALSYHLPSSTQDGGPDVDDDPVRVQVLRESMATMTTRQRASWCRGVLFGGDDNVDESRGQGWDFMRYPATGLHQVVAPQPTLAGRRTDDFRVRGLQPLDGFVLGTPGDHDAHGHTFRWIQQPV